MAIHVEDKETDALVREFARRRGVGITAAIKLAVEEATGAQRQKLEALRKRIQPIIEEIRIARAGRPLVDQKAFMDDMWGEND
jgi:antitoxin VapB